MLNWTDTEFLRPLVTAWLGRIEAAYRSPDRVRFTDVANECKIFYARSTAALWGSQYAARFMNGVIEKPRFPISVNKAFEAVAVIVPNLLWDVPYRNVTPKQKVQLPDEAMQILMSNPGTAQMMQALGQQDQQDVLSAQVVAALLKIWLNYTAKEVPDGGLCEHSQIGIIDAMLTGRGAFFVRPYAYPASDKMLTGVFREDPLDVLIDPDVKLLKEAKWIALRHRDPYWKVEERFQLPADSLKHKATLESAWAYGEVGSWGTPDSATNSRINGDNNDVVVWYEVWSKSGAGGRFAPALQTELKQHLAQVVGDFAYICIAANVPYPLNCPTTTMRAGASDDEVKQKFAWPIPVWTDNRWPCELTDFYPDPDSVYPVAPLAPGMGWLKFMNVLIPFGTEKIYSGCRDFWAVLGSQVDEYRKYIEGGATNCIIPVNPVAGDDIRKIITILQQPPMNLDFWKVMEMAADGFAMATGLTPFLYGMKSESNDRSAEETNARARAAGVRPQFMQKRVAESQGRLAALESFCARWFIKGRDVQPLCGATGAWLWEQYVMSSDPELVVRQMAYEIAVSSIRRPDRERDMANFNQVMQVLGPGYLQYAMTSGDFRAWNGMVEKWAEYHDIDDPTKLLIEPDPQAQQQQQQIAQQQAAVEQQKVQADLQIKQMELEGKKMDVQAKMADAQIKAAAKQMELGIKQQDAQLKQESQAAQMMIDMQKSRMDAEAQARKAEIDLSSKAADAQLQRAIGLMDFQAAGQKQAMDLLSQKAQLGMTLGAQQAQHQQNMQQSKEQSAAKVQAMKQQAKAKPHPKPQSAGAKR